MRIKAFLITILLFTNSISDIPISFTSKINSMDIKANSGHYEWRSFIRDRDSVAFEKAQSHGARIAYLNGNTHIYYKDKLYEYGEYSNGVKVGEWIRNISDTSQLRSYFSSDGIYEKTERYELKNDVMQKVSPSISLFFKDYEIGIQPPIMISGGYPLSLTLSSLNFHCDIPSPPIKGDRIKLVLASEIGLKGYSLRAGLSPFSGKDWSGIIGFTPLTVNASFTQFWKDSEYDFFENTYSGVTYIGGDIDWSGMVMSFKDRPMGYIMGALHLRAGCMVPLSGPDEGNPKFIFSIGATPGSALFFMGGFGFL